MKKPHSRAFTEADRAAHKRLRALWDTRKQGLGLTQEGLAERWGITQGPVAQYLNGHTALGVVAILRFAEALGCSPTEIRPDFTFKNLLPGELSPDAVEIALLWMQMPKELQADLRKMIDRFSSPSYIALLRNGTHATVVAKT